MSLATVLDGSDTTFTAYVIALGVSGLIMLFLAIAGFGASGGVRVINALLGLAFLGYGVYLAFIFDGGEYRIFVYAFIVPILVILNAFRTRKASKDAAAAQPPAA